MLQRNKLRLEMLLVDTAKEVLGTPHGKGTYNVKEVWWWNKEAQS